MKETRDFADDIRSAYGEERRLALLQLACVQMVFGGDINKTLEEFHKDLDVSQNRVIEAKARANAAGHGMLELCS